MQFQVREHPDARIGSTFAGVTRPTAYLPAGVAVAGWWWLSGSRAQGIQRLRTHTTFSFLLRLLFLFWGVIDNSKTISFLENSVLFTLWHFSFFRIHYVNTYLFIFKLFLEWDPSRQFLKIVADQHEWIFLFLENQITVILLKYLLQRNHKLVENIFSRKSDKNIKKNEDSWLLV